MRLAILLLSVTTLLMVENVKAQQVITASIGSGVAAMQDAHGYSTLSIAGQPLTGTTADAEYISRVGFWYAVGPNPQRVANEPTESGEVPYAFVLEQNYPNPFNPATSIRFDLSQPIKLVLQVSDILGRKVVILASGNYPAGSHEVIWDASGVPSGIYLYSLEAGTYLATRKMVLHR